MTRIYLYRPPAPAALHQILNQLEYPHHMIFDLENLTREHLKNLPPAEPERQKQDAGDMVMLDANENSLGSPLPLWYNRYIGASGSLLEKFATIKAVSPSNIMVGNGSAECLDLLFLAFCEPGRDNVIICSPAPGIYSERAWVHNVETKEIPLTDSLALSLEAIEEAVDEHTKMILLCSPNDPTGNSFYRGDIETILNNYFGLVVLDEAYINFSRQRSFIQELADYPNLVILQTMSKAWGLAGLRLSLAIAAPGIITVLNRIRPPYNISLPVQELATKAMEEVAQVNEMIREIVDQRAFLEKELSACAGVEKVFPSDANFLLVRFTAAKEVIEFLNKEGILVYDAGHLPHCDSCLRITVGTEEQNRRLISLLRSLP